MHLCVDNLDEEYFIRVGQSSRQFELLLFMKVSIKSIRIERLKCFGLMTKSFKVIF